MAGQGASLILNFEYACLKHMAIGAATYVLALVFPLMISRIFERKRGRVASAGELVFPDTIKTYLIFLLFVFVSRNTAGVFMGFHRDPFVWIRYEFYVYSKFTAYLSFCIFMVVTL